MGFFDKAKDKLKNAADDAKKKKDELERKAKEKTKELENKAKKAKEDAEKKLKDTKNKIKDIPNKIPDPKDYVDKVKDKVKDLGDKIKDPFVADREPADFSDYYVRKELKGAELTALDEGIVAGKREGEVNVTRDGFDVKNVGQSVKDEGFNMLKKFYKNPPGSKVQWAKDAGFLLGQLSIYSGGGGDGDGDGSNMKTHLIIGGVILTLALVGGVTYYVM